MEEVTDGAGGGVGYSDHVENQHSVSSSTDAKNSFTLFIFTKQDDEYRILSILGESLHEPLRMMLEAWKDWFCIAGVG